MTTQRYMWSIEVRHTGSRVRIYSITNQLTLGRADDNDIIVPQASVSRHHGKFVLSDAGVRYVQVGRTNPTFLRGEAIAEAAVTNGDVLMIAGGDSELVELHVRAERHPQEATSAGAALQTPAPMPEPASLQLSASLPTQASGSTLVIGRDAASGLVLPNPLVSRRHARLGWKSGYPELRDLASSNGTFVNGVRITKHHLREGDLVQIGTYRLRFDGAELEVLDRGTAISLRVIDLSQSIKGTSILQGVSFICTPGQVTAIAGSSGAGKTTLLDALTGIRPAAGGSVALNGLPLYAHFDSLRSVFGYVPQANILHKELPLQRALEYSARLRLPPDTTRQEIAMRSQFPLHILGLWGSRDLPIEHLSGGQQKRASVAVELLTEPALLFLDEPTSGLDPGLTVRIMKLLRMLADSGKTIVVVSHDSESFSFCDQLVFLATGGHSVYVGPPGECLQYFGVDTFAQVYDAVESETSPEVLVSRFHASPQGRKLQQLLGGEQHVGAVEDVSRKTTTPPRIALQHQLRELAWRYTEILIRDRRNALLLLLQAPLIALLLAILVRSDALQAVAGDPASQGDAEKVILLMAISAIWLGTINACREVVKEIAIWRRERLAGVEIVPYILSKIVPLSALAVVQNVLFMFVLGFRVDYPGDGLVFPGAFEMFVTLLLASVASVSMGLAISAWSSTEERAMTVVPLALIPQILFAGTIFDLGGVATVIASAFTARWAVQALGATAGVDGYAANAGPLLGYWLILVVMAITYSALAGWLLARRTRLGAD